MSDRYNAFTVVLKRDTRDDDAESILTALKMVKGVQSVTPNVSNIEAHIAEERVRQELGTKLWQILYPKSS